MFYSEYEKKILKIAKIKNLILKYKVLIISVLAVLIAGTVALLATKGNVSGEISGPSTIVYGQGFEFDGISAALSDITYEYSLKGSDEWTTDEPYMPGTYLVRAYSKGSFGKIKYSDIKEFTIVPKDISINISLTTVEYGLNPSYSVDLELNNRISNIDFIFEDITSTSTRAYANKSSIKIVDSNNNDVTNCYNISTPESTITFTKCNVTIKPITVTWVYDGSEATYNNELENVEFAYNEKPTFSNQITDLNGDIVSPINVGTYKNNITDLKIYNNDLETTANYNIEYESGVIEVVKRSIKVKTNSQSITYNGQALINDGLSIASDSTYDLVEGHRFVVKDRTSITNVGKEINVVDFDIVDSENNIVTDNYDISYNYGTLEISPIEINIETPSLVYTYNGENQYDNSYNYEANSNEILANHTFKVVSYSSYKYVGNYTNSVELKIYENNLEVTSNYIINYNYGSIVINKRDISIKSNDYEKTYDGISFSQSQYTLISGYLNSKENLSITTNSFTNAGSYNLDITSVSITEYGMDVTDNFNVIKESGTLLINKLYIEIGPRNVSHTFDGNVYSEYDKSLYHLYLTSLHRLGIEIDVEYYDLDNNKIDPVNAGEYYIKIKDYTFINDIEDNYIVNYDRTAILTINKRVLAISPIEIEEKDYDGNYVTYNNVYDNYILLDDYSLTDRIKIYVSFNDGLNSVSGNNGVKDAGTYTIELDDFETTGIKDNYEIDFISSTFIINPKSIVISPVDTSFTYGDVITYNPYEYEIDEEFIGSDGVYIDVNYYKYGNLITPKNAGIYDIYIENVYFDEGISSNYNFTFDISQLTINKKEIFVELDENNLSRNDLTYNGEKLTYNGGLNNFIDVIGLQYDEQLEVIVVFKQDNLTVSAINAGIYELYINDYRINGDYSYNYIVSMSTIKTVEIIKRNVEVEIYDDSKEYNGKTYEYDNANFYSEGLIGDDSFNIEVTTLDLNGNIVDAKDCGEYYLSITGYEFIIGEASNYNIIYGSDQTLSIYKRIVYVSPVYIADKVYDGEYIEYPNNESNYSLSFSTSFVLGDTIKVYVEFVDEENNTYDKVVDANTYYVRITGHDFINGNEDNYDVIYHLDKYFTIHKKVITVKPNDITVTYGDEIIPQGFTKDQIEELEFGYSYLLAGALVEPRNVGSYDIELVDIGLNDLNEQNYEINYLTGTLTIIQRSLKLTASSADTFNDKVYDGLYYEINTPTYGNYEVVSGNVVYDDQIMLDLRLSNGRTYALNVGEYTVKLEDYYIQEPAIKENYSIEFEEISFKITKRNLEIELKDMPNHQFNNMPYTYYSGYDNFNLINGEKVLDEKIEVFVSYYDADEKEVNEPTNPGTYKVLYNYFIVSTGIEENYNIECLNEVTFVIYNALATVRPIILNTSKTYDGAYYSYDGAYEIINVEGITEDYLESLSLIGHFIDSSGTKYQSIKNANEYTLLIDGYSINNNKFNNVTINIEYNDDIIYTINKRNINIYLYDDNYKIYDGEEFVYNRGYYDSLGNGFIDSDYVELSLVYYKDNEENQPIDSGVYEIYIKSYRFIGELESNYNIEIMLDSVLLTIDKRPVWIIPVDQEDTPYTGYEYQYPANSYSYKLESGYYSVLEGDIFNVAVRYSLSINGEYVEAINANTYYIRIFDVASSNPNYDIYYDDTYSTLTITPITLNVSSNIEFNDSIYGDMIYEYSYEFGNYILNSGELVNDERLMLELKFFDENNIQYSSVKDVGIYRVMLTSYETSNLGLNDSNYIVIFNVESFSISKREIMVEGLFNFEGGMYGEIGSYEYDEYMGNNNIISGQMQYGEELLISLKFENLRGETEVKNASLYKVSLNYYETTNGINDNNYDVSFNEYEFEILQRKIEVKPIEVNDFDYNGYEYIYPTSQYILTNNSLAYNDEFILLVEFRDENNMPVTPKYAGIYYMYAYDVEFVEGLKDNYIISYSNIPIEFEIKKLNISIKPIKPNDKDYDGYEVIYQDSYENYLYTNGSRKVAETDSFKIVVNFYNLNDEVVVARDALTYKLKIVDIIPMDSNYLDSYIFTYYEEEFTINKLSITVKPIVADKEYNKNPYEHDGDFDVSNLGYGDNISFELIYLDEYGYETTPIYVGEYTARISNVYINNIDYRLNSNYEVAIFDEDFSIIQKKVYIKPNSYNSTYNGEYFEYEIGINNFESIEGLLDELSLEITVMYYSDNGYNSLVKDANTYTIEVDTVKAYNDTYGLYKNYSFETSSDVATLKIDPLAITITTIKPESKVYDGIAISNEDYKGYELISGEIVASDVITLSCLYNGSTSVRNAGEYKISVDYYTLNGKRYIADKVSNYDIEIINCGEFTISKRNITLKPIDMGVVPYTGLYYSYESNSNNYELVNSEYEPLEKEPITISVEFLDSNYNALGSNPISIGTYYIKYNGFRVNNGLSSNYNISDDGYGELSIVEREVTLRPILSNTSHTYDGSVMTYNSNEYEIVSYKGLSYDEIPDITIDVMFRNKETGESNASIKDAGSYEVYISDYEMDGILVSVSCLSLDYTINQRNIELKLNDISHTYNGEVFKPKKNYEVVGEYDFVNGEGISINYSYYNSLNEGVSPINVGEYQMKYMSHSILNSNEKNYIIDITNKEIALVINPSILELELKDDIVEEYSGIPYSLDNKFYIVTSENGLFGNDKIIIKVKYTSDINGLNEVTPIDVNTYYIHLVDVEFISGESSNYDISFSGYKALEITKKRVSITLINDDIIYNGNNYYYDKYYGNYASIEGLLIDTRVIVEVKFNDNGNMVDYIVNAGSYEMIAEVIAIEDGVIDNYEYTFNNTIQIINERTIIVSTGSISGFTYDGLEKSYESYEISSNSLNTLVEGHSLYVKKAFSAINAGVWNNEIVVGVKDALNVDLSENYDISYEYGTISIDKRSIKVKTKTNLDLIYNGEYQRYEEYEIIDGSLVDGHELVVLAYTSVKNVSDEILNVLTIGVYSNTDESDNYDISYEYGKIKVTPLDVVIEFKDYEKDYDGYNFVYTLDYVEIKSGDIYDSYALSYDITNSNGIVYEMKNVDTYNLQIKEILFESNEIKNNYNITFINGLVTVTINIANIHVETNSYNGYYNGYKQYALGFVVNSGLSNIHSLELSGQQPYVMYPGDVADNKLSFIVTDENSNNVSDNYNIIYDEIGKLSLEDTLYLRYSRKEDYTGKAFTNVVSSVIITDEEGNIVSSYRIEVLDYNVYDSSNNLIDSPINVGRYSLELTNYIMYVNGAQISDEVLNMYTIIDEDNYFEINKIEIDVKPMEKTFVYDGNVHSIKGYFNSADDYESLAIVEGILPNHVVIITGSSESRTDYGTSKCEITDLMIYDLETGEEIKINSDYDGTDLSSKYEYYNITYRSDENSDYKAKLKIARRTILVKTASASKVYDGETLMSNDYEIIDSNDPNSGLIEGHYISGNGTNVLLNVGKVAHTVSLVILDEEGNYKSGNYVIEYTEDSGYLEITKRKIEVYVTDINTFTINGTLLEGHKVVLEEDDGEIECKIVNDYNVVYTRNYDITIVMN